jgi:hypothetical protein
MRPTDVKRFLDALTPEMRRVVVVLRHVVRCTVPRAEESLLWGCLSYHRPEVGGRVKGAVCQVVVKRGQVRLDFIHGVRLSDPSGLLQGDRLSKWFIPIRTIADAKRPGIASLIRAAGELDSKSWAE